MFKISNPSSHFSDICPGRLCQQANFAEFFTLRTLSKYTYLCSPTNYKKYEKLLMSSTSKRKGHFVPCSISSQSFNFW